MVDPQIEQLQKLVTSQETGKADVIVWLQGNMYDRGKKVLELYQQGLAPLIVVTGNNERVVDDDYVKVVDIVKWLEKKGLDKSAILIDDKSMNTYGQALHVMEMAQERAWSKILLVGSTHHQLRAFLTFLYRAKQIGWQGQIINQPVHIDWDTKPSGRRKITKEAFQDELAKLGTYKSNFASVEEGLKYLKL